jgi:peptidoglycan glycosyltransferase
MNDVSIKSSVFRAPTSDFNRAELASGFNKETNISPIHAAVLAQIIANDGEMIRPRIIEQFSDAELNQNMLLQTPSEKVISLHSARELRDMMELTVKKGTARKSFQGFFRGKFKDIEVGGKTGSITGGEPFGKRDWFTGFSYKGLETQDNISICVMLINKKKWTIRSSLLARRIIEYYFSNVAQNVAYN